MSVEAHIHVDLDDDSSGAGSPWPVDARPGRPCRVAYPTISRIENGHDDLRRDTLMKIAAALGKRLVPTFEARTMIRLADIGVPRDTDEPDWTRLRSFADQIALHPEWTAAAIADAPSSGSPLMSNLLAAIAEKLADDSGIQRPGWTKEVAPLESPWEAPATPQRRATNAENTPAQFAARRITLAERAIWRDRELIST
ncbi:MAG: helix-turn-helix domain-containing protein [Ilumatobacter sp.]|uniref:helix-turn-helix domain-containing protein n=1 Tax=Ilumatobacter sp. TaxID=1967498 RepID=UPI00391A4045